MTINEGILALPGFNKTKQVRVIGPTGEQLGNVSVAAAMNIAYEKGLDLVLVAPQGNPPVCKVLDFGKFRFERDKKEKEARKNQQVADIKEVQLSCNIDVNDFNTKARNALKFLGNGDKVRVVLRFKGRQLSRTESGVELLERFKDACAEKGVVEKEPILEGRSMTMFITPLKASSAKKDKVKEAEAAKAD